MPIYVPAQPYPKKANDNIRSSDWNSAIDEVMRLSDATQYLNRNTFNGPLTVSGLLTASAGLTVTGDETVSGKLTVNGTALSELKGPLTVSGLLTASGGITGPVTVHGALTVNGVLGVSTYTRISQQNSGNWAIFGANMYNTGSSFRLVNSAQPGANLHISAEGGGSTQFRFCLMDAGETNQRNIAYIGTGGLKVDVISGITGPITVNGVLRVGSSSGMLQVGSLTTISQNTGGNWAAFGKNLYIAENGNWLLNDTSKPGVNFHMSADGADNKEFRFNRREANSTVNVQLAAIGTGGLTIPGGISGVDGRLTIHDSFMGIQETTVVSTNWSGGPWASFGSNAYYRGNSWNLVRTNEAGVCLVMSSQGGASRQFAFCRMVAGSTTATDLVTIGTAGLTVTGALTASGGLTVTGNQSVSGELTITGLLRANGGINGGVGVRGNFKVDSILEVDSITRVSQHPNYWAVFGSNMYASGGSFRLVNTSLKGANIHMSGQEGGTTEFRFALMDPGQNQRNIATIGREGITSSPNGTEQRRVATGHEFLYIIRGKVNANGSVGAGSGFSASRISTGYYQITFSAAFSSLPIAVATQYLPSTSDTRDNAVIVDLATNLIKVKVGTGGGAVADRDFTFIAVGPRTT